MALSAYEIIKRSSPSLAKHFKETEETTKNLVAKVDKFSEKTEGICDYLIYQLSAKETKVFTDEFLKEINQEIAYTYVQDSLDNSLTNSIVMADTVVQISGINFDRTVNDKLTLTNTRNRKQTVMFFKNGNILANILNFSKKYSDYNSVKVFEVDENSNVNITRDDVEKGCLIKVNCNGHTFYVDPRNCESSGGMGEYNFISIFEDMRYKYIITGYSTTYDFTSLHIVTTYNANNWIDFHGFSKSDFSKINDNTYYAEFTCSNCHALSLERYNSVDKIGATLPFEVVYMTNNIIRCFITKSEYDNLGTNDRIRLQYITY